MLSNKAAVAAIGVVALAGAAATGVFLASRGPESPAGVAVSTESAAGAAPAGVDATEAVIEETSAPATPPAPVAAPVQSKPAPVAQTPRRAESPRPAAPAPQVRERNQPVAPPATEPRPADRAERGVSRPAPAQEQPVDPTPITDLPVARDERRPDPIASLPVAPQFEEVTVPADAVIGLKLETSLSSDTARVEDRVEARVARDVRADGRVAIPAGSRVLGSVSVVDRGGKMRERARLGVRFHTVILADGTEVPLQTETVLREGESPGNASAAKVGGGAIGGAILGAILGGGKGAAIGAGVGAGAGTAAVMAGGRRAAQIQSGSPMTVKVLSPVTVAVEK